MRRRTYRIGIKPLVEFFTTGSHHRFWVSAGIPPGSTLVGVSRSSSNEELFLTVENQDFAEGDSMESIEVTTLPVSAEMRGRGRL